LANAHTVTDPIRIRAGPRLVLLAELLALLPPELAEQTQAELRAVASTPPRRGRPHHRQGAHSAAGRLVA
jgi:hypothetical protein